MTKEEKQAKKLAKNEAKIEKKEAKAEKANAKYKAKAEKKHAKAYASFVKDTEKKNAKLQAKAQKDGKEFIPIAIPDADEFQSKKEIKAAKATTKAYGKYVKKLEKKNSKAKRNVRKRVSLLFRFKFLLKKNLQIHQQAARIKPERLFL